MDLRVLKNENLVDEIFSINDIHRYIEQLTPVKLPLLFKKEITRSIPDYDSFLKKYGDEKIPISREYTNQKFRSQKPEYDEQDKIVEIRTYYNQITTNQQTTPWYCTELPTPVAFKDLVPFSELEFLKKLNTKDSLSFFFFGNEGNKANLHFDGDFRAVLLTQILGTKRIILIPPNSSKKLLPMKNFSGLMLDRFTEDELMEFIEYSNALVCEISAGETIYIPQTWWHHIDYVSMSVSINLRLPRNRFEEFLGSGKLHISNKSQSLVYTFRKLKMENESKNLEKEINKILNCEGTSPQNKWSEIDSMLDKYCLEYCPNMVVNNFEFLHDVDSWHFWDGSLNSGRLYK